MKPKLNTSTKPPFTAWYLHRVQLWDQLEGQGLSYQEIADRTHDVTARTVKEWLATYRIWLANKEKEIH